MKSSRTEYITISRAIKGDVPEEGFWKYFKDSLKEAVFLNKKDNKKDNSNPLVIPEKEAFYESLQIKESKIFSQKPKNIHKPENVLWISATKIFPSEPRYAEIIIINGKTNTTSYFWERWNPFTEKPAVYDGLKGMNFSNGLLFRYTGKIKDRPTEGIISKFELQESKMQNQGEESGEQMPDAFLNPLILKFACNSDWPEKFTQESKDFCNTFRDEKHLLDICPRIYPRFTVKSLLRYRLLHELHTGWKDKKDILPPVQRMLFKSDWNPSFIPFALLDELQGYYEIDGFASGRPVTFSWIKPEEPLPEHARWLADWCCGQMGIEQKTYQKIDTVPRPAFAEQLKHYRFFDKTEGLDGLKNGDSQLLNCRIKWKDSLTNREKKYLDELIKDCSEEKGFDRDYFLTLLGQQSLLPRSPIYVRLPDAPSLLTDKPLSVWQDFQKKMRVHLTDSPLMAEKWWLELVFPLPPEKRKTPEPWIANTASWWYLWYDALFSRPADFQPEWCISRTKEGGLLGTSRTGFFVLGGKAYEGTDLDAFRLG